VGNEDNSLGQEEHFTQFIKSLGFALNNDEMDNEEFYIRNVGCTSTFRQKT